MGSFKRVVYVGAVVIEPNLFCKRVFAAGFVIEEDDGCFYAYMHLYSTVILKIEEADF